MNLSHYIAFYKYKREVLSKNLFISYYSTHYHITLQILLRYGISEGTISRFLTNLYFEIVINLLTITSESKHGPIIIFF